MSFFSDMVGETNKTKYSKISTEEMIERLNNGQKTFSEDSNGKQIIRYNKSTTIVHDRDYIISEDEDFVITMDDLFNFKYYVKLGE